MGFEPPAGIIIRAATSEDAPAIEALLPERDGQRTAMPRRNAHFLVAESEGEIAGAVGLEILGGDGILRALCVDQRYRGQGVGRALVERSLTDAALEALDAVYLVAANATNIFARFGFVPIDRTELPSAVRRAIDLMDNHHASAMPMKLMLADR